MKNNKELIYHIIDWSIAIIGIVISIIEKKIMYVMGIILIAIILSIIIAMYTKLKEAEEKLEKAEEELEKVGKELEKAEEELEKAEEELEKAKEELEKAEEELEKAGEELEKAEGREAEVISRINLYEVLLDNPDPLYGIVNYISKKTKEDYQNKNIKLSKLSLEVRLVNDIVKKRHNDLQIFWTFKGKNISEEKVDKLYLKIGGDSSTEYSNLGVKAIACEENSKRCEENCNKHTLQNCEKKYEMNVEDVKEYSTKTFHLLTLEFTEPINPHGNFETKVRYIWPQCFNPYFDFLLIDPKNFASAIAELSIRIYIDECVITEKTIIYLHSICLATNLNSSEGKFKFDKNEKCFTYDVRDLDNNKIYYVTIKLV